MCFLFARAVTVEESSPDAVKAAAVLPRKDLLFMVCCLNGKQCIYKRDIFSDIPTGKLSIFGERCSYRRKNICSAKLRLHF